MRGAQLALAVSGFAGWALFLSAYGGFFLSAGHPAAGWALLGAAGFYAAGSAVAFLLGRRAGARA